MLRIQHFNSFLTNLHNLNQQMHIIIGQFTVKIIKLLNISNITGPLLGST